MSLAYLYTCDNCGSTVRTDRHWPYGWTSPRPPRGWVTTIKSWTHTLSDQHLCLSCTKAAESARETALAKAKNDASA